MCHVIHISCVYNHHLVLYSDLLLLPGAADLVWPAGQGRVRHGAVQASQRSTGLSQHCIFSTVIRAAVACLNRHYQLKHRLKPESL